MNHLWTTEPPALYRQADDLEGLPAALGDTTIIPGWGCGVPAICDDERRRSLKAEAAQLNAAFAKKEM